MMFILVLGLLLIAQAFSVFRLWVWATIFGCAIYDVYSAARKVEREAVVHSLAWLALVILCQIAIIAHCLAAR